MVCRCENGDIFIADVDAGPTKRQGHNEPKSFYAHTSELLSPNDQNLSVL
jgi:hypothetical protein